MVRQIWTLTGASTQHHPAPYPLDLAYRLIRVFSFVGDTVLDPFLGTGTTMVAALKAGRNSQGIDIEPRFIQMAKTRLLKEASSYFVNATITERANTQTEKAQAVQELPTKMYAQVKLIR